MRDKVARVRRLLEEATTAKQSAPTSEDFADITPHTQTASTPHYAVQSLRARTKREITRIASWYGWSNEIDRALDAAGATSTARLNDEQLGNLLTRMMHLEECVQNATDSPDSPPAR